MIRGLHHELKSLLDGLAEANRKAGDGSLSARDQHDARELAGRLPAKIEAVRQAIQENQEALAEIAGVLVQFECSKHKTRHRAMVITHLENAQDRLRRELGDEPPAPSPIAGDLAREAMNLLIQIERCGASPELTTAAVMADELRKKLEQHAAN